MKKPARKLSQIGRNSIGIILPPAILKTLGWRERQRVFVSRVPRGILIRDAVTKHKKTK